MTDLETKFSAALALAVRAPSVHNSQPWRWQVGSNTVDLYADPDRQLRQIDPERRDLLLSCGAALQHFTLALSALELESEVRRFPNPADRNHLAGVQIVGKHDIAEEDISLAAAIPRRRTDRRWFSSWPVPRADITRMAAQAAHWGVTLQRVDDKAELATIVGNAVRKHLQDPDYLAELTTWSGRHGTASGVPAENTPAPESHGTFSARVFADPRLAQPEGVQAREDAGVTVVLATAADDAAAHLKAGEATGAILLTATALGLAACPLTEPLELAETRAELKERLLAGHRFPQMLLRVGWPALNADPLPATPRRPLADVVSYQAD